MSERVMSPVVVVGDKNTHHFFALYGQPRPIETDSQGRIAVYTNREKCHESAAKIVGNDHDAIIVCGMGDDNWKQFREEMPHYIVE